MPLPQWKQHLLYLQDMRAELRETNAPVGIPVLETVHW
jgi:hypothetical protein